MKPSTFHNTILTLVGGYAEALAETEAARASLPRRAPFAQGRLVAAGRDLLEFWDKGKVIAGNDPGPLFEELRGALSEVEKSP